MDTKKFNSDFSIKLKPHGKPQINYGINDLSINNGLEIYEPMELKFNLDLCKDSYILFVDFYNKTNEDSDMALEIESVTFEGLTLDRFKWNSKYFPNYPEPWASQQSEPLPKFQQSATYMGWNGRWELYFDVPIFPWIHKLENLGWLYE